MRCLLDRPTPLDSSAYFKRRRRGDLSLAEFLQPRRIAVVLENYGRAHGEAACRVAVASEWSKRYFAAIVKPMVTAAIMIDWRVPLAPDNVGLDVKDDGTIVGLRLSSFGGPVQAISAEDRFNFLITDNLAVVVDAIANVSGLSRHVLWSNAGNVFEGTVRNCAAFLEQGTCAMDHAFEILEKPYFSRGVPNPLRDPIVYRIFDGKSKRLRRVCCIRYLLNSLDYCATCPCSNRKISRVPG